MSSVDGSSRKNNRTNYSPDQVRILEKVCQDTPYLDPEKVEELALELNVPEARIKVWFQNKRARFRRRVKDSAPIYPVMSPMSPSLSPVAPHALGSPVSTFAAYSPAPQVVPGHYQPYPSSLASFYSPSHHHQFYQSPQTVPDHTKQPVAQQSGDQPRWHSDPSSQPPILSMPTSLAAFPSHFLPFGFGPHVPLW